MTEVLFPGRVGMDFECRNGPLTGDSAPEMRSPTTQGILQECHDNSFTSQEWIKSNETEKERKHKCEFCAFATSHLGALKSHMAVQHKEKEDQKPLACKFCGYRTSYRGNLKKHIRIHTGEKPFACRFCGKRFASKSNHKTHELTHTRLKRMKCPVPQCFFSCNRNELQGHFAQCHTGMDPARFNIGKFKGASAEVPVKQEVPPTMVETLQATHPVPPQVSSARVVPQLPVKNEQLSPASSGDSHSLPSDTLIWSMQQSVMRSLPVFPTYTQQAVFPGVAPLAISSPNHVAPYTTEDDASPLNLVISESESSSEMHDTRSDADISTENLSPGQYLKCRHLSESSDEPATKVLKGVEHINVPADSTSNDPGNMVAPVSPTAADEATMSLDLSMNTASKTAEKSQHIVEGITHLPDMPPLIPSPMSLDKAQTEVITAQQAHAIAAESDEEKRSEQVEEEEVLSEEEENQIARIMGALVHNKEDAKSILRALSNQGHLFHCSHCNIFFPEYSTYVLHRGCHGNKSPFVCHFCQTTFVEKFGFLAHFMQCANAKKK